MCMSTTTHAQIVRQGSIFKTDISGEESEIPCLVLLHFVDNSWLIWVQNPVLDIFLGKVCVKTKVEGKQFFSM